MRLFLLALGLVCVSVSPIALEGHDRLLRVGTSKVYGTGPRGSFVLDDGNVYKPISKNQKKATEGWQLNDNILILATDHSNRFVLVNQRTNQRVKVKVISVDSDSL